MPIIFQYGSNCDESRLNDESRLAGRATDLGSAQTVAKFELAFNKRRQGDGSAAADLIKRRSGGRRIWGVLYEVSQSDLQKLADQIEGPSYRAQNIRVEDAKGVLKTAKTFRVRREKRQEGLWTSADYVKHIVKGLRAHDIPEDHVWYVIARAELANQAATHFTCAQTEIPKINELRGLLLSPKYGIRHWQELSFKHEAEWQRAIDIVENRIAERFVSWIDDLIPKKFAGFVTTALDCLLLETLHGFIAGGSTKDTRKAYETVLKNPPFSFSKQLTDAFYEGVRNGIIHDTETRKGWKIRMTPQGQIVETDGSGTYVLNRTMFHGALKSAFSDWITTLRSGNQQRRRNMHQRMEEIIKRHYAI